MPIPMTFSTNLIRLFYSVNVPQEKCFCLFVYTYLKFSNKSRKDLKRIKIFW